MLNILIIFFVPKFETIFEKLKEKGELPALTTVPDGVQPLPPVVAGDRRDRRWRSSAFVCFVRWTRRGGRVWADRVKIRLPLFGPIFLNLALSRFCRILGTMLHNGIPILQGAAHRQGLDRQPGAGRGHRAESAENVTAGQKLADPLRKSRLLPAATWSR